LFSIDVMNSKFRSTYDASRNNPRSDYTAFSRHSAEGLGIR
jgi:hypothetical protein